MSLLKKNKPKTIKETGTSLTVQWMRLLTSKAGAQVQFLVRELRFQMPCSIAKKKKNFFKTKINVMGTTLKEQTKLLKKQELRELGGEGSREQGL